MKQIVKAIFAAVLSALLCAACASGSSGSQDSASLEMPKSNAGSGARDILQIISELRAKHKIPAMAAAIVTSKGLQSVAAIGTRKIGTDIPVTLNDLWHLGSDTKAITSTLAAILVERGKLRWDSRVSELFPDLENDIHPAFYEVTLTQLLSHVAGLAANIDYGKIKQSLPIREQRIEAIRIGLSAKPLSAPGTQYLYSNLGYIVAGAMIERALNMDWEKAVEKYVFTPLKMASAGFGGLGTPGKVDQPWGHLNVKAPIGINGPSADNPNVLGPAGRIHCTIQDWALFIADLLRGARGEPALLKPESYKEIMTPQFGGDYALGWMVAERDWAGGAALAHAGSNTFFYALAWVAPKKDFAILVCTNEGSASAVATDECVSRIITEILQK